MTRWILCLLLLATPAAAKLTRPERQAIRACRQACRAAVLFPTTTTMATCPTTTTATTTTTLPGVDTPCGILREHGDHDPISFGDHFDGTLTCAAGIDTFQGYWPLAPPPAAHPVTGGCTGTTATFVDAPATLSLTCPTCCPAGMTVPQ